MSESVTRVATPAPPYTTRQYAELCGISIPSVKCRIKSGMVQAHKEGRFWMIDSKPIPKGNLESREKQMDLTGARFGRITVLGRAENGIHNEIRYKCVCDCGAERIVYRSSLLKGSTKSCGCLNKEIQAERFRREKKKYDVLSKKDRLYRVWKGMRERCTYPAHTAYKNYGGRGIKVCDEWMHDYAAFRDWAMATGYDPSAPTGQCTLDRIDVNGNYEPSNCRWVSMAVQNRNKRNAAK